MKHRILLIEDDEIMRVTIKDYLVTGSYEVHAFEKGKEAMAAFNEDEFSLVVTDIRLPDMNGFEILKALKVKEKGNIPVIMMTAFGTIKDAVDAIKMGAFDYITKPFSLDEFNYIVERALEVKDLKEENVRLRRDLSTCYGYSNIIGESPALMKVFDLVEKVAKTDSSVLILGENGTGKELIATTIHYQSKRGNQPLIKVNCAAFPEALIESELFGYEKGAFTGALQRKPGRFERAHGGSIFLDEIGDLAPSVQIKLLRVLQEGSLERLGSTESMNVDIRVIVATNRNLEEDVAEGIFREDLYYRLNVIPILVPPLRERREDIPLLIDHFMDIYNCRFGRKVTISPDTIMTLMDYDFPGNIRELGNIVERCVTLSTDNMIETDDLPPHILKQQEGKSPMVTLNNVTAEAERVHILKILASTKGNKTRAAEILGISRKSLWEKMKTKKTEM